MGDNLEGYIQCRRFKRISGTVLYCEGTDKPLVFGSRDNLRQFLKFHCNRPHPFCTFATERTVCVMERPRMNGRVECDGYNIPCNRDTCPHYKSEDDAELARLKTAQRLMELEKEERKSIKKKYRL